MKSATSSKLRLNKLALFRHIGYRPHAGQLPVHVSTAPRRVLACGVRFGKSHCAAMEAIAGAMAPAESSLGWLVTPSYALTDLLFQRVRATIEEKLAHRIIRIEQRERLIVLRNLLGGASEIRGRSADTPSNLLGAGLDWVIVDEAAALRDDIWPSYLSGRLVDRKGWGLLVSTPRGRGAFYELWKRGQPGGDPTFESWRQPSWANPLLDPEAIELERGRVPPAVFAQEFAAEFLGPSGHVVCTTCGAPERQGIGIVVLEGDEELARCAECGREVDAAGNPLGAVDEQGQMRVVVIKLELPKLDSVGPGVGGAVSV